MRCLLTLCSEASFVQLLSNQVGYFVPLFNSSISLSVTLTDKLLSREVKARIHKSVFTLRLVGQFPDGWGLCPSLSLVPGWERVNEFLQCISTLGQLNTRAALCHHGKQGEALSWVQEWLVEVGRVCNWFMKCRIGGMPHQPDGNRKGQGGKATRNKRFACSMWIFVDPWAFWKWLEGKLHSSQTWS